MTANLVQADRSVVVRGGTHRGHHGRRRQTGSCREAGSTAEGTT